MQLSMRQSFEFGLYEITFDRSTHVQFLHKTLVLGEIYSLRIYVYEVSIYRLNFLVSIYEM